MRARCVSCTKSRGSILLLLNMKYKTPLASLIEKHQSVCLGVEGGWSLLAPKPCRVSFHLDKDLTFT